MNIKERMKYLGIRQAELSSKCGVSQQKISYILDEKLVSRVVNTATEMIRLKTQEIKNQPEESK